MKITKKNLKWIFLGFGVSSLAVALPIYLNANINSRVSRTSKANSANSSNLINPIAPTLTDSNFFKIFNSGITSVDLGGMGKISAIKISGLPFTTNGDVKTTVLNSMKITSAGVDEELLPDFVTQGGFQTTSSNKVVTVSGFASPQAVEFNYFLPIPKTISEIGLMINTTNTKWAKVGSISLMNEEGDVFRLDNVKLSDLWTSATVAKDGSEMNVSFSKLNSWNKWVKNNNDVNDDFMWSYKNGDFALSQQNQIYFYDADVKKQSIVPIISGGNANVNLYTTMNGNFGSPVPSPDSELFLSAQLTNNQKVSFLKEINDSWFIQNFMSVISMSTGDFKNLNANILMNFDATKSKNYIDDIGAQQFYYPENSKDWNLSLVFDGSSSSEDRSSLANLSAFGLFKNVRKVTLANNEFLNELDNWNEFDLNALSWLGSDQKLESIYAPAKNSKNWDSHSSTLHTFGDFTRMNWLSKIPNLNTLDISSLTAYGGGDIIDQISSSTFVNNLLLEFKIYVLNGIYQKAKNSNIISNTFDVSNIKSLNPLEDDWTLLKKNVAPSFILPQVISNPNYKIGGTEDQYIFNEITVNDKKINVMIKGGKLYWNFIEQHIDPMDIVYLGKKNYYYTSAYVTSNNLNLSSLKMVSKTLDYYANMSNATENLRNDGDINMNNSININKTINVDNRLVRKVVYNSKIMYDIDLNSINYYVLDKNLGTLYFTSIDKVIEKYGIDNLAQINLFTIKADNNGTDYASYKNLDSKTLVLPDPIMFQANVLDVDGKSYSDIISKGIISWNLNNLKVEDILYKSLDDNSFHISLFDSNGDVIPRLVSIDPHAPYSAAIKPLSALVEPGSITSLDDMNLTITIDGQKYDVQLNNGIVEYNTDITVIKYVRIFVGVNGMNSYEYYSALTKIPKTVPTFEISSIEKATAQLSAQKNITNTLDIKQISGMSNIRIDGKSYQVVIRNGSAFWNVDEQLIKQIKYSDSNNNYYTSLTNNNFQNVGMSQVVNTYVAPSQNTLFTFPQKLTSANIQMVENGVDVLTKQNAQYESTHYRFVVKDGQVYLGNDLLRSVNYATKNINGVIYYYYSIQDIPASEKDDAWSVENNSSITVPEEKIIVSPDKRPGINNPFEKLIIINNSNIIPITIVFDGSSNKYYFTNLEELKKIKFVDKFGNYYQSLAGNAPLDQMSSVNISKSDLNQNSIPLSIDSSTIDKSSKEIGKYIAIFGAVTAVASGMLWGTIAFRKRYGRAK